MRKIKLLGLLILLLSSCKKEAEIVLVQSFKVYIVTGVNYATLIWDPVEGYSDSVVEFTLNLDDSLLVKHLKSRIIKISNLSENKKYLGKLEAFSGKQKIAEQTFTFTTLKNQPPREFNICEFAVKNNSVALKWNGSADPEGSTVVYDIYLNNLLKVSSTKELSCELSGLYPAINYSGEIIARDSAGNTCKTPFTFKTINTSKSILVHRFIEYQGYKRDFAYYMPSSYDSSNAIPLVISLHGANGNAWSEIGTTYSRTIADRENFILLMPQALSGTFNGLTFFQWNAHYIFAWDDVSLLNYLIDYMYTRYKVDLSKVYISGMSNGGYMTFFAARGLQERVAAIAPISGLISYNVYANYTLNRPIPLCYMHGTADNIVRIDGYPSANEIIRYWVRNNNCDTTPQVTQLPDIEPNDNSKVTLYKYNGSIPDSEIQYFKIEGGGHSVPGVEPGANMDINAYEVIWTFFSRHSYPHHAKGNKVELN